VASGYPGVLFGSHDIADLEDYEKMVEKSPINKSLKPQPMILSTNTVVSGRLNVVRGLKRTNYLVSFGKSRHMIGLYSPSQELFGQRPRSNTIHNPFSNHDAPFFFGLPLPLLIPSPPAFSEPPSVVPLCFETSGFAGDTSRGFPEPCVIPSISLFPVYASYILENNGKYLVPLPRNVLLLLWICGARIKSRLFFLGGGIISP
jgi:hypothetical protein